MPINPILVVISISLILATVAYVVSGRKSSDFFYYTLYGILGGSLYVLLPWFRGGNISPIYGLGGLQVIGIFSGGAIFIGVLFRSQRRN